MEVTQKVSFDILKKSEKPGLLRLFKETYPTLNWSPDYFKWQYEDNPAGEAKSWIARRSSEIIGNCTAIPLEMHVKGRVCLGWRIQDVLTRPAYSGLGIYHRLSAQMNEFIGANEYPLNFAFPNERSHQGFVRMGWVDLFRIPLRVTPSFKGGYPAGAFQPRQITIFDKRHAEIWDAHRQSIDFAIHRSAKYLNWRYILKPGTEYHAYHFISDTDELVLILKDYLRENGQRWAHICDMFQSGRNHSLHERAIQFSLRFCQEHRCQALGCWWPGGALDDLFDHNLFRREEDITRWLIVRYHASFLDSNHLAQENRWHLVMGDSDVY